MPSQLGRWLRRVLQVSSDYLAQYPAVQWLELFGAALITAGVCDSDVPSVVHDSIGGNKSYTECLEKFRLFRIESFNLWILNFKVLLA